MCMIFLMQDILFSLFVLSEIMMNSFSKTEKSAAEARQHSTQYNNIVQYSTVHYSRSLNGSTAQWTRGRGSVQHSSTVGWKGGLQHNTSQF